MKLYTVYDSKSESFTPPMANRTRGEAIRGFTDEVNNPNSMLNKHPEDYTLFELAEWDNSTGQIIPLDTPLSCGLAIEYKNSDDRELTSQAA